MTRCAGNEGDGDLLLSGRACLCSESFPRQVLTGIEVEVLTVKGRLRARERRAHRSPGIPPPDNLYMRALQRPSILPPLRARHAHQPIIVPFLFPDYRPWPPELVEHARTKGSSPRVVLCVLGVLAELIKLLHPLRGEILKGSALAGDAHRLD